MNYDQKEPDFVPIKTVINNVKRMAWDSSATKIAKSENLVINSVCYEDCARNKFSVWGPCISDMTLQVNNERMPVIREPNYTDKTWDVELDKIPLVVGNHDPNPGAKLKTVSLREYLENFNDYMSTPPKNIKQINLIANHKLAKQSDKHVIMSSQCCFLPIEKGKETKFNVALFNYQSEKEYPAVLVIVGTSKGTSAQIIQGKEQKLLFNNYGGKASFVAQRLTDNRIERGVSIQGEMTKEEKQDNCIIIIQVPLKQGPKQVILSKEDKRLDIEKEIQSACSEFLNEPDWSKNMEIVDKLNASTYLCPFAMKEIRKQFKTKNPEIELLALTLTEYIIKNCPASHASVAQEDFMRYLVKMATNQRQGGKWTQLKSPNMFRSYSKKPKKRADANVEAAIVKIRPNAIPICSCGNELDAVELRQCYPYNHDGGVACDKCGKDVQGLNTKVWHCSKGESLEHEHGYDLCMQCGEKQLLFDELDGLPTIERDSRYPIRVTLQYYKSTDNGIITKDIMRGIKNLLEESQKQADFIGSLVTNYSTRSTEPDLVNDGNMVQPAIDPFEDFGAWDPFDNGAKDNIVEMKVSHGKYSKIARILAEIDGNEYLQNFKNEEVKDEDLANLWREDLMELIPKMGPRNRFLKMLKVENSFKTDTSFMSAFL